MEIDFDAINERQRYKLMASLIVPRPIALVTTISPDGTVNAAPFSLFNMLGEDPPLLIISIDRLKDGNLKDTALNILRESEFVVHLVDEPIANKMHRCADRFPPNVSEPQAVGFETRKSARIKTPRIAEAPAAFECTLWNKLETASRHIFIGKVHMLHARDEIIDLETWRVRLQNYFPVGRFGATNYVKTRDRFDCD